MMRTLVSILLGAVCAVAFPAATATQQTGTPVATDALDATRLMPPHYMVHCPVTLSRAMRRRARPTFR